MLLIDRADVDRRLKLLRLELAQRSISEELRGWSYDRPPVEPFSRSILFGVGELAGRYCETLRDVYLRRVLRIRPPVNLKMVRGVAIHETIKDVIFRLKRFIYDHLTTGTELVQELIPDDGEVAGSALKRAELSLGHLEDGREEILEQCRSLYRFIVIQAAAKLDYALSKYPHAEPDSIVNIAIPPVAERKIDGSLVGLSRELSVDIYTPYNAVIDIKTGGVRSFHPLTAAGYALALEGEEGTRVDFGFIIYL